MNTDNTQTLWELAFWDGISIAPHIRGISTDKNALRAYHRSLQWGDYGFLYPLVEDIDQSNDMLREDICHWVIYECNLWLAPLSDK